MFSQLDKNCFLSLILKQIERYFLYLNIEPIFIMGIFCILLETCQLLQIDFGWNGDQ